MSRGLAFGTIAIIQTVLNYLGLLGIILGVVALIFANTERGVELLIGGIGFIVIKYVIGFIFVLLARRRSDQSRNSNIEEQPEAIRREIVELQARLAAKQYEIEHHIHSLKPGSESAEFVPPFPVWLRLQDDNLNLEEALDGYIYQYQLLRPTEPDEPAELTGVRTRLSILESSRQQFAPNVYADLDKYIFALRSNMAILHMKWEVDRRRGAPGELGAR